MMIKVIAGLAAALVGGTLTASAQVAVYGETKATLKVRSGETGLVRALGNEDNAPIAFAAPGTAGLSPEAAAAGFLSANRNLFGLGGSASGVSANRTLDAGDGRSMVRLQQHFRDVPVLGAELNVQVDGQRNIISVTGKSVGDLELSVAPSVTAANARLVAIASAARRYRVSPLLLAASEPELVIHDPRVIGGPTRPAHLVWLTTVTDADRSEIREIILVDAVSGRVSVQFNNRPDAAPPKNAKQLVCDAAKTSAKKPCTASIDVNDPASSKVADVRNAHRFAEQTYDFYARRFNRNSLDGKGMILKSTVRWVPEGCSPQDCPDGKYRNASWNGSQMIYGVDYASADDVVGHELSHGVTEFTSNLFYYFQSGAINEALSDIFGEYLDQTNGFDGAGGSVKWVMGEDLPIGAIRSMSDPTKFGHPDRMQSSHYTADEPFNDHGGVHTNSGVANKAAFLMADTKTHTFNGQTIKGFGIDKAAAIWFRVNSLYLNSGSDYIDLGIALNRACSDLVGKTPRTQTGTASPSGAITAANCKAVANAVKATEMDKPPLVRVIPAEARVCTSGKPSSVLFERFDNATAFFTDPKKSGHWKLDKSYAASNTNSMSGGDSADESGSYDTALVQVDAVQIPTNGFLRFAQFYDMAKGFAGGVVEYQVAGETKWNRVTSKMFAENPYTVKLTAGLDNVLEGSLAFSGLIPGWSSSRVDLSSLAGKKVKFRFRIATGFLGANNGWLLDDIRIYSCK